MCRDVSSVIVFRTEHNSVGTRELSEECLEERVNTQVIRCDQSTAVRTSKVSRVCSLNEKVFQLKRCQVGALSASHWAVHGERHQWIFD